MVPRAVQPLRRIGKDKTIVENDIEEDDDINDEDFNGNGGGVDDVGEEDEENDVDSDDDKFRDDVVQKGGVTSDKEPVDVDRHLNDEDGSLSSGDSACRDGTDVSESSSKKEENLRKVNKFLLKQLKRMQKKEENSHPSEYVDLFMDTSKLGAQNKHAVKAVVKNFMFQKQKFVTDKELRDLSNGNTLPHKLMDEMGWSKVKRNERWSEVGILVKRHLDTMRSSRTVSMRKQYNVIGEINVVLNFF